MASSSEIGHAVNIANFKLIIDGVTEFGVAYDPSNTDLTVVNMTATWTAGDGAQIVLNAAMQNSKLPIDAREILVAPLNKLITKTINYYNSTKASKKAKKDAKGLADKIRGYGVKVVKLPTGLPDPAHVSTSHQSFVQRADVLNQLIAFYTSDVNYAPNEAPIKLPVLNTLWVDFNKANNNIGTIIGPVETARIMRDHKLYDAETGMVDVAKSAKGYVKGLYGATSAEAKTITKIKIVRLKKIETV